MPKPGEPALSGAALTTRCRMLGAGLAQTLDLAVGEVILADEQSDRDAVVSLRGRASEIIKRNMGKLHPVVPLCVISKDVLAWAGYRESWSKLGQEQSFTFVDGGFTVHLGRVGEIEKPQVLRSEWVGPRSRAFVGNAGHPHWQLDVLETARKGLVAEPMRFGEPAPTQGEFKASPLVPLDLLRRLTLERMHLASAASWWRPPPQPIAYAPESVAELNRWILACTSYLRQEIARCVLSDA